MTREGWQRTVHKRKGLSQSPAWGSPLSPILGAFFLTELDDALGSLGLFYVRYMDDILVLAPTRWKLRHAVKVVNQGLASLRLEKHPEKTLIGRIESGFAFWAITSVPMDCVSPRRRWRILRHVCASFMSKSRERVSPPGLVPTCDGGSALGSCRCCSMLSWCS